MRTSSTACARLFAVGGERTGTASAQRAALGNGHLVRYAISVLLNIVAEWGVYVGVLVLAYERADATATGLAAIALVVPNVAFAPLAGALAERYPAQRVRIGAMLLITLGLAISALAAYADLAIPMIVAPAMVAITGATILRPACAVLRPAIARSSRELTVANLWDSYADSASVFLGPLAATAAIGLGGPEAAIATCAALAFAGLAVGLVRQPADPPPSGDATAQSSAFRLMRDGFKNLRSRPGAVGVMIVSGSQFFLVGSFDILVVVAADEQFGLGPSGAGALATALGAGAFGSSAAITYLVGRRALGPVIAVAIAVLALGSLTLGTVSVAGVAFVLLPVIGVARGLQDHMGQILLQRSADPSTLGPAFALLELTSGLSLLAGSLTAQIAVFLVGTEAAFVATGLFFVALLGLSLRSLRLADASADVPVVAMSLLRRAPVFTPLPPAALEVVARSAEEVEVEAGRTVIRQGEPGDRYYVVADGSFSVEVDGREVSLCRRGEGFGELALLADVPRAATVTAVEPSSVLAIERTPFLIAVTGHDSSRQAAWGVMRRHHGDAPPVAGPEGFATARHDDADA